MPRCRRIAGNANRRRRDAHSQVIQVAVVSTALCHEGALAAEQVGAVLAVHVQPELPAGDISTGIGTVNAAFDDFELVVHGIPGHGAYPHTAVDPVPILANIISATHELVSRTVDPTHPAVITIGTLGAGASPNVIAAQARCEGMIRATNERDRADLHASLHRLATGIAAARGATATVDISLGGPALVNDANLVAAIDTRLSTIGSAVTPTPFRSCGSDDFSHLSEAVPGVMIFVGTQSVTRTGAGERPGLHHPAFLPPMSAVRDCARVLVAGYVGAADLLLRAPAKGPDTHDARQDGLGAPG